MEIKILTGISEGLARRVEQFTIENFYTEREKTPEGQTNGMIAPINSSKIFKEIIGSKEKFHIGSGNW